MKALIVVDAQYDFMTALGKLPVPGAQDIIETIRYCIEKAREKGMKVIYTQDWHAEQDIEFKIFPEHCIKGTRGAEIVDPLMPRDGDCVIRKSKISAWPEIETVLADVDEIFVTGVATEYCVKAFVDGCSQREKIVRLIVDAIKGVDEIPGVNKTKGNVAIACLKMGRSGVGYMFSDDLGVE